MMMQFPFDLNGDVESPRRFLDKISFEKFIVFHPCLLTLRPLNSPIITN